MNDSTESFGCCSYHQDCREKGDCVQKNYWKNYDRICSLWRRVISKMSAEKEVKVGEDGQYSLFG
jgi:hypothetical protein